MSTQLLPASLAVHDGDGRGGGAMELPWPAADGLLEWTVLSSGSNSDGTTTSAGNAVGGEPTSPVHGFAPATATHIFDPSGATPSSEMLYNLPPSSSSSTSLESWADSSPSMSHPHAYAHPHSAFFPTHFAHAESSASAASLHPFYTVPSAIAYASTQVSPAATYNVAPMLPTTHSEMPPPTTTTTTNGKKRLRLGESTTVKPDPDTAAAPQSSLYRRALGSLAAGVSPGHVLHGVTSLSAIEANCFRMTPLKANQKDYFNRTIGYRQFAVHLVDPSQSIVDVRRDVPLPPTYDEHDQRYTIVRPRGRTLHLIVTLLPYISNPRLLADGFAYVIVCRRSLGAWMPLNLALFNPSKQAGRNRLAEVAFHANLDHCKHDNGRRIWGQSTSHIRSRGDEPLKALRLEPRGPVAAREAEEYCFYVALFDSKGKLLKHDDGLPCLARTNIVRYETDDRSVAAAPNVDQQESDAHAALLRAMGGMTLVERANVVSNAVTYLDAQTAVLTARDPATLMRVGVRVFDLPDREPDTAVSLTNYAKLDTPAAIEAGHIDDDFAVRIRAVAKQIGWHHADMELYDPRIRTLESFNTECALERFKQIRDGSIAEANAWLRKIGVGEEMDVQAIRRRAEMAAVAMRDRKFRGTWMVCMTNPYPDRILVDRMDPHKVHCLADTMHEANIRVCDRMQILVRLAYCVKAKREQMDELIFKPYVEGFKARSGKYIIESAAETSSETNQRFRSMYSPSPIASHPVGAALVELEKFELLLHAMHLDYFLYWTLFRNAASVRRIYRRLLEEDKAFAPWYFAPGRFTPFEAPSE